jgi:hypothetical protein
MLCAGNGMRGMRDDVGIIILYDVLKFFQGSFFRFDVVPKKLRRDVNLEKILK